MRLLSIGVVIGQHHSYSRTDLQTYPGSAFDNPATLTSDLFPSRSVHTIEYMCTDFGVDGSSVFFFLECGQTEVTDANDQRIHVLATAGVIMTS